MPEGFSIREVREWLFAVANLPVVAAAIVWRRLMFRTMFIAITGSVGKTTTKDSLAAILSPLGLTVSTIGNDNGRHGIPRTILRVRPWHRFAVIEIGIRRPGTMWRSAFMSRPDVVVMLGVGRNHNDEMHSVGVTTREKVKLIKGMRRGGLVVRNSDDSCVAAMAALAGDRVHTFGSSDRCDTWID